MAQELHLGPVQTPVLLKLIQLRLVLGKRRAHARKLLVAQRHGFCKRFLLTHTEHVTAFASAFCSWSPNIMRPATKQPAACQGEEEDREGVEEQKQEQKEDQQEQRRNESDGMPRHGNIADTLQRANRAAQETMVPGNNGTLSRLRGRL